MSPIDSKTGRILLVEDDPGYQELMATMLCKTYQFTMCSSAEEALEKLAHERCDLIISDINLLGMTGFEVLGRIAMDIVAVLTKVVQRQQKDIEELKSRLKWDPETNHEMR